MYNITFSNAGLLTPRNDLTWSSPGSTVEASSSCDCPIQWQAVGGGGLAAIPNLISATFTITRNNQPYVNSSTGCAQYKKRGILTWEMAINVHTDADFGNECGGLNTYGELRAYVTATTFWDVKYVITQAVSNIRVDMETGNPVAHTINLKGSAANAAGTLGTILKPGGGAYWPPA